MGWVVWIAGVSPSFSPMWHFLDLPECRLALSTLSPRSASQHHPTQHHAHRCGKSLPSSSPNQAAGLGGGGQGASCPGPGRCPQGGLAGKRQEPVVWICVSWAPQAGVLNVRSEHLGLGPSPLPSQALTLPADQWLNASTLEESFLVHPQDIRSPWSE